VSWPSFSVVSSGLGVVEAAAAVVVLIASWARLSESGGLLGVSFSRLEMSARRVSFSRLYVSMRDSSSSMCLVFWVS